MNTQRNDILTLINAAITKQKLELSADFSLTSILPIIKKHNIISLCYYGAIECGIDKSSEEMKALFKYVCQYIYVSRQQDYVFDEISRAFDQNGISYMPLKGILLKKLYPYPEMRIMGDLDVLIKTEDYPKVKSLMQEMSYSELKETDHELPWKKGVTEIELHKRLIPSYNKDYFAYYGDGWKIAKINDGVRYSMTDEDQLIYLFTHFSKHYRDGGIGIKQMVDLWVYRLRKPDLDEAYLKKELKALSLYDFYKNVMITLSVWFEGENPTEITDLISNVIFDSGVFGNHDAHVLSEGVKLSTTSKRENARISKYLKRMFLPYSSMCRKYKILKPLPFLLPIMWVVRWIDAILFKRKTIESTIEDINLMSQENVNEQNRNLKLVGLSFNFKE